MLFLELKTTIMKHLLKSVFLLFSIIGLGSPAFSQQKTFVKDSIMLGYMKSGYSNTHFKPEGKTDKDSNRQGKWKDYEVRKDYALVDIDNKPKQIRGYFLVYGEGKYVDNKKDGDWDFYVIEDISFKKILQKHVHYQKGIRTDEFKYYFPNGKVAQIGKYENNNIQGEVKAYYSNGSLYGLIHYKDNKKEGTDTYYYPNGVTKIQISFKGDSINGEYTSYYENKTLQEKSYSNMGSPDSTYRYYYSNGQLWIEKKYNNGLLMNVTGSYDQQGKPRDKGTLKDGTGTVNYYTEDGTLYNTQTYKDGKMISEASNGTFR
jgi:antitoxin component YwqK of YwqJK toxin-antitoxin module